MTPRVIWTEVSSLSFSQPPLPGQVCVQFHLHFLLDGEHKLCKYS